jgi:hypothetical protein
MNQQTELSVSKRETYMMQTAIVTVHLYPFDQLKGFSGSSGPSQVMSSRPSFSGELCVAPIEGEAKVPENLVSVCLQVVKRGTTHCRPRAAILLRPQPCCFNI